MGKGRRTAANLRLWTRVLTSSLMLCVVMLAGCPRAKSDPAKSAKRLDLAKDALSKGNLDGADAEVNKALAYMPNNDEAYNLRGLVRVVRAAAVQRLLE